MVEIFVQQFGQYDWRVSMVNMRTGMVLETREPMTGNVAAAIESQSGLAVHLNTIRLVRSEA